MTPVRGAEEKRNFSEGIMNCGFKPAEHDIGAGLAYQVVQPSLADGAGRGTGNSARQGELEVAERGKRIFDVLIHGWVQQRDSQLVQMVDAQ